MELTDDDRKRIRNNYARMISVSEVVRIGGIPYDEALNVMTPRERAEYYETFVSSKGEARTPQRGLIKNMQSERGSVRDYLLESFLDGGYSLDGGAIDTTADELLRRFYPEN